MALDLSRSRVTDVDVRVLAAFAHGSGALESLSLARTGIGRDGVVAALGVPSLTFLDISRCKALAPDEELRAVGEALLASTTSRLGALKCDAFELAVGATRGVRLTSRGQPTPGVAVVAAGVLRNSRTVRGGASGFRAKELATAGVTARALREGGFPPRARSTTSRRSWPQ